MKTVVRLAFGVVLAAAAIAGCRNEEPPVSPQAPSSATPQPVDQRIVGSWCDAATMDAIEFRSDGTWRPLYVYGMMVHDRPISYYDTEPGGTFVTTVDGKCILSTSSVTFSSPTPTVDTCAYAVSDNNATLILLREGGASRHTYSRRTVGDMVQ